MDKIVHYSDSPRVGRFNLTYETLRDDREMCKALFSLCIVLAVEDHESGRGKTYTAASDLFQPLQEDEEIPFYRIEMVCNQPFENPEREAQRVDSGPFGFVAIRQNIIRVPALSFTFQTRTLQ
jgi:hypothetical protein